MADTIGKHLLDRLATLLIGPDLLYSVRGVFMALVMALLWG